MLSVATLGRIADVTLPFDDTNRDLGSNNIDSLPAEIGNLESLSELCVGMSGIHPVQWQVGSSG